MNNINGPTVVFEFCGFAIAHTTRLWRSCYSIAVKVGGEVTAIDGFEDEPVSHLIARFNPEVLADLEYAVEKDKPAEGEPIDLDWEIRRRNVARIRAWVEENEREPLYFPATYDEGESAWDEMDSRGYPVRMPRVAVAAN